MIIEVDIPDELLPAVAAEFSIVQGSTTATTPEEYFIKSIIETLRQRAEIYKVGPYYEGPVNPQFNADGTPYGWVPPEPEDNEVIMEDEGLINNEEVDVEEE